MTKNSIGQWCYYMIFPEDSERLSFDMEISVFIPCIAHLMKSIFWILAPVALILGIEWLTSL